MRKRNLIRSAKVAASAFVAGLILTATVGSAWSYFTTYTSASGGYAVALDNETQIVEEFSNSTKRLVVTNDGTQPVYVRATAYSVYDLEYRDEAGMWVSGGDGYYYYSEPLDGIQQTDGEAAGNRTSELSIQIAFPEKETLQDGDGFNVVVIYESTPVQYDDSGNARKPWEADWSVGVVEGGVE